MSTVCPVIRNGNFTGTHDPRPDSIASNLYRLPQYPQTRSRVNCHSPSDTSSAVEFLAWHIEVAVQKRIFVLNLRVPVDGPLPQGEVKVANPVRKRPCVWRIVDFGRTGSRSADLLTVPTLPRRANDHHDSATARR